MKPEQQNLENLRWMMESPCLLAEESAPLVADSDCAAFLAQAAAEWSRLQAEPASLNEFIQLHRKSGRLGNLFEALLQFWLKRMLAVRDLVHGVAIREGGATRGELDFVFRSSFGEIEHWEAAVKFFMCIAPVPELAVRADSFVGQALVDRLDRKLELSLKKQLPLAETLRAREVLAGLGFSGSIRSRLFFKGRLFYPLAWDWRRVAAPPEVSPRHERGWWISWEGESSISRLVEADRLAFGESGPRVWVMLGKERWMGRVSEPAGSSELLDDLQLRAKLDTHFASSTNAVQVARVEQLADGAWQEPAFETGMGRGMVLIPGWPNSVEDSEELLSKF
jgi:hypothetical protein